MAAFCLSNDLMELKDKLGSIMVAYTYDNKPVYARDLKAQGAMAALLKDALKPNLVQSLEGTPAFIHGGPFANIAHGCNSIVATKMALHHADYVVTEAGFGADLGAEKFFDIKCRLAGLIPDAVVIVATVRALKYNGGVAKEDLNEENLEALEKGLPNLLKHVENMTQLFHVPAVVAINHRTSDTEAELNLIQNRCNELGVNSVLSDVWALGGEGGKALAEEVVRLTELDNKFTFLYEDNVSLKDKITTISQKVYGAAKVEFSAAASRELRKITRMGYGHLPICMAKTQYSLTDDAKVIGRPEGFTINVREVVLSAGAGFVVAVTGEIMRMPGLPKVPSAEIIDVDADGKIKGLF
jgi:formate--tetrahydrofolate ligase